MTSFSSRNYAAILNGHYLFLSCFSLQWAHCVFLFNKWLFLYIITDDSRAFLKLRLVWFKQDEGHQRRSQLLQVKQGKADATALENSFGKILCNLNQLIISLKYLTNNSRRKPTNVGQLSLFEITSRANLFLTLITLRAGVTSLQADCFPAIL